MLLISNTLTELRLGNPTTFLNLTLFPLRGNTTHQRDYITLREAVRAETASVQEVSEGGSIPELLLKNTGKMPVLVLEGEELIGAKQNRTANVTILAPAGKTITIPVTCVEAGRWGYRNREFAPSDQLHFRYGRMRKATAVSESMRRTGRKSADQGEVWNDIADKCLSSGTRSRTGAMSDVYETHRQRTDDYVGAFKPDPEQVAAVFAIGDRIEGLELFDCADTLADMLPKLIRSYAIDALENVKENQSRPSAVSADAFIQRLARAEVETYPAVGLGTEVRITAPTAIGGGLVADERVVHLAAFASPAETTRSGGSDGNVGGNDHGGGERSILSSIRRRGRLFRAGNPWQSMSRPHRGLSSGIFTLPRVH